MNLKAMNLLFIRNLCDFLVSQNFTKMNNFEKMLIQFFLDHELIKSENEVFLPNDFQRSGEIFLSGNNFFYNLKNLFNILGRYFIFEFSENLGKSRN